MEEKEYLIEAPPLENRREKAFGAAVFTHIRPLTHHLTCSIQGKKTPSERRSCYLIRRRQREYLTSLQHQSLHSTCAPSIIHSPTHSTFGLKNEIDCDCFALVMEANHPNGLQRTREVEHRRLKAQCVLLNKINK